MSKHLVTATVYDRAGNVISRATNNYTKSHPIQARFAASAGQPERVFLHAELSALIKLKGKIPYRIHVERYRKDGRAANAAPCAVCLEAIKHWKINHVTHTTDEAGILSR